MIFYFLTYILCGFAAGLLAGLLGIGGGIVIVPVLATLLTLQKIPPVNVMHIAVATSLAIMIVTGLSSAYAHYRQGAVLFGLVKRFFPGTILGSILGALLASHIHGFWLQKLFGIFLLFMFCQNLFKKESAAPHHTLPKTPVLFFVSTGIATLATVLGIAGGAMMVTYFTHRHIPIRQSVATVSVALLPVTIVGSLSYAIINYHITTHLPWSTGYLYWPAFLGISIPSVFSAPLGSYLSHHIDSQLLRKIFLGFLLITSGKMLLF